MDLLSPFAAQHNILKAGQNTTRGYADHNAFQ